jgi:hypothetical protein
MAQAKSFRKAKKLKPLRLILKILSKIKNCFQIMTKNQAIIQQTWATVRNKKHKPSSLFYKIKDMHEKGKIRLSIGDLYLIQEILNYRVSWVYEQCERLQNLWTNDDPEVLGKTPELDF